MSDPLIADWARKVRDARRQLSLTQAEFGTLVGVTGKSVSEWERELTLPRFQQRIALQEIFEQLEAEGEAA